MARLNIEDTFWIDVLSLVAKLGDQDKAIGMALRFIKFAQEKHRKGLVISHKEFEENGFNQALLGVFAEAKPSGIEAKGSEKHFAWLNQKILAGTRGGASKSEAKTKTLKNSKKGAELRVIPEAKASVLEASYSYSSSLRTNTPNASHLGEVAEATPKEVIPFEIQNPVGYFIGCYRKAFRERYPNTDPDVRGKVQGQIKALLKDYPLDKAKTMIQVYCQMDGAKGWFKTKGHDFGTFMENLNPIAIALATGADSGSNEINWNEVFGKSAT